MVFRALCAIARAQVDIAALSSTVATEPAPDIDKDWEDAPVRFDTPLPTDAGAPCGAASAVVERLEQQVERAKREAAP